MNCGPSITHEKDDHQHCDGYSDYYDDWGIVVWVWGSIWTNFRWFWGSGGASWEAFCLHVEALERLGGEDLVKRSIFRVRRTPFWRVLGPYRVIFCGLKGYLIGYCFFIAFYLHLVKFLLFFIINQMAKIIKKCSRGCKNEDSWWLSIKGHYHWNLSAVRSF